MKGSIFKINSSRVTITMKNVFLCSPQHITSPDIRFNVIPPIGHFLSVDDCRISNSGPNRLVSGSRHLPSTSLTIRWCFQFPDERPTDIRRHLDRLEAVINSQVYSLVSIGTSQLFLFQEFKKLQETCLCLLSNDKRFARAGGRPFS